MAHGTADYGITTGQVGNYKIDDMGELAARLGSVVTFDRLGEVVFLDDFENGINGYEQFLSGAGAEISNATDYPFSKKAYLKMIGGSDAGLRAKIFKYLGWYATSKMGIAFMFSVDNFIDYILIEIWVQEADKDYSFQVKIDVSNKKIYIVDDVPQYIEIESNFDAQLTLYNYIPFKLVVDNVNHKYYKLLVGNTNYDLSNYNIKTYASVDSGYTRFKIQTISKNGKNGTAGFDNLIITQNE